MRAWIATFEDGCANGWGESTRSRGESRIDFPTNTYITNLEQSGRRASRPICRGRKLTNTLVRKPGAGDRHAPFDERDLETGLSVTAPDLDSTRGWARGWASAV